MVVADWAIVLSSDTNGTTVFRAKRGDVLTVLGELPAWFLVSRSDGKRGYVAKGLVRAAAGAAPARSHPRPAAAQTPTASATATPRPTATQPPLPLQISHAPLKCIVAGTFPQVEAQVTAHGPVDRARVYFKSHSHPDWYYVEMTAAEASAYRSLLPQPLPGTTKLDYYLYAMDRTLATKQTEEYQPTVAKERCGNAPAGAAGAAPPKGLTIGGTREGQEPVPPGFDRRGIASFLTVAGTMTSIGGGAGAAGAAPAAAAVGGGGFPTLAVVGVVGAGAAVGAAVVVAGGGDDGGSPAPPAPPATSPAVVTTPPTTSPGAVPTPTRSPTRTPTPPPATTPSGTPDIDAPGSVSFQDLQEKTIAIDNAGGGELRIGSISLSGVGPHFPLTDDNCSNESISGGRTCRIKIRCDLMGTGFQSGGFVRVPSNDQDETEIQIGLECGNTPLAGDERRRLFVNSALDDSLGAAQIVLNGTHIAFPAVGVSSADWPVGPGSNRIELTVVSPRGPGTWRIELRGSLVSGSLRPVAGNAQVLGGAIVARFQGIRGERALVTFDIR